MAAPRRSDSPPPSAEARAPSSRRGGKLVSLEDYPLSRLERWNTAFARRTYEPGVLADSMRFLQRTIGCSWIDGVLKNVRQVHGLERLPPLDPNESYLCVANHRSFFDLYSVAAYLVKRGMTNRLVFPVRSNFFYDHPLGFFVNGLMSFYAMYPPIFRERKRAAHNLASLDEVVRLAKQGGAFIGLHPEGTRNKGDDPYALLPAQGGVGRVIYRARTKVLPVFVNGLSNDFLGQIRGGFDGKADDVIIVFGEPVDFGSLLDQPESTRVFKALSEKALADVAKLGEEERAIRATLKR